MRADRRGRTDAPGPGAAAALAELSAGLAAGEPGELPALLERAAGRAGPEAVEEALLQSHLFLGFPAALAGLRAWRQVEEATGEGDGRAVASEESGAWEARGEEVCRRVYGAAYDDLRRNVRRLHPDLDAWMIRDGYGKVLGRDGLDLATRELCIVAILAADGAHAGPLHSHLRGALRVGAEPSDVRAALETGLERRPEGEGQEEARELWRRVRARAEGARGERGR